MVEIVVKVPKELESEENLLRKRIEELVRFEVKRKTLLNFIDKVMKGAKQLSDKELIELGRELKKGRFEELETRGLV